MKCEREHFLHLAEANQGPKKTSMPLKLFLQFVLPLQKVDSKINLVLV